MGDHVAALPGLSSPEALGSPRESAKPRGSKKNKKSRTRISASWGPQTMTVTVGSPLPLSGVVHDKGKHQRPVSLQRRIGSGWYKVAATKTKRDGTFAVSVPTGSLFTAKMRLKTVALRSSRGATSGVHDIETTPDYVPVGSSDSWDFVDSRYDFRWNPCETITYRTNRAPENPQTGSSIANTDAAFALVAQATGLRFKNLGTTSAIPGGVGKWPEDTNIIVSWSDPSETTWPLGNGIAAYGGVSKSKFGQIGKKTEIDGRAVVNAIHGFAVLDKNLYLADPRYEVLIIMHELGHAMGLGHAPTSDQVMSPTIDYNRAEQWGAGDLVGLNHTGLSGGCVSPLRR